MAVIDKSAHTQVEVYRSIPHLIVMEHQALVKQLAAESSSHKYHQRIADNTRG